MIPNRETTHILISLLSKFVKLHVAKVGFVGVTLTIHEEPSGMLKSKGIVLTNTQATYDHWQNM